ncbi:hypothetical protein [Nocardioides alcanivorans]|uniref:hypothetical protein n=1 Tax=Nocardioides alcanivorans TaxID=2897352 RepID=UPI001F24794B|nr:hypothetical protein [Nocardioides alcanivorans]
MILALSFRLAGSIHRYLFAYAPSNVLIRYLRSATGRRWAFPISAVLTAGYLAATAGLTTILEAGGPGWFSLVALTCAWNAIKFAWVGVAALAAATSSRVRALLGRTRRARFADHSSADVSGPDKTGITFG